MVEPRIARIGSIAFAIVFGVPAILYGYGAFRLSRMSSWDERRSPSFHLAAGVEGSWDVQWEPREGTLRSRPLLLRSVGNEIEGWPRTIELLARVEPPEALGDWMRPHVGADGWIRYDDPDASGVLGIAEPPLVRRIEWRVVSMEPAALPTRFYFLVPGDPDSEHPDAWPFLAGFCVLLAAGSAAFVWLALANRTIRREVRPGTFRLWME